MFQFVVSNGKLIFHLITQRTSDWKNKKRYNAICVRIQIGQEQEKVLIDWSTQKRFANEKYTVFIICNIT